MIGDFVAVGMYPPVMPADHPIQTGSRGIVRTHPFSLRRDD